MLTQTVAILKNLLFNPARVQVRKGLDEQHVKSPTLFLLDKNMRKKK